MKDASAPRLNCYRRVVVVGAGARDHALCDRLARSADVDLHVVPGNAGIAAVATCHGRADLDDMPALVEYVAQLDPDLVIIGPEDLLVAGLASRLADRGIVCLGPTRDAARLEGSKRFAKELMQRAGVPTPRWRACTTSEDVMRAAAELGGAVAVKADGLAAGCGVYVCRTQGELVRAVDELMDGARFGASGDVVIVEELVDGRELSVLALVDGEHIVPFPAACDYKRLGDGGTGPNTGGMGAHLPSEDLDETQVAELAHRVISPILRELRVDGTPFRGIVYAGVMLTDAGPVVLEYNCRLGNPETQALLRVLDDDVDLLALFERAASGTLAGVGALRAAGAAVAVCVASPSYPREQVEPQPVAVRGVSDAEAIPGIAIFTGLGARFDDDGTLYAAGGRVITVSAHAETMDGAVERAYRAVDLIELDGMQVRRDIGASGISRAAAACSPPR